MRVMTTFSTNVEYFQGMVGGSIRFVTDIGGFTTAPDATGPKIGELQQMRFPRHMNFTVELREVGPLNLPTNVITAYTA